MFFRNGDSNSGGQEVSIRNVRDHKLALESIYNIERVFRAWIDDRTSNNGGRFRHMIVLMIICPGADGQPHRTL